MSKGRGPSSREGGICGCAGGEETAEGYAAEFWFGRRCRFCIVWYLKME